MGIIQLYIYTYHIHRYYKNQYVSTSNQVWWTSEITLRKFSKNEPKKGMLSKNQVHLPSPFILGAIFGHFHHVKRLGRFPHQLLRQVPMRRTVGRPGRILAPKQEVSPSHCRRLAADGMSQAFASQGWRWQFASQFKWERCFCFTKEHGGGYHFCMYIYLDQPETKKIGVS